MTKKFYILVCVDEDIAEVRGPFTTSKARDKELQRIRSGKVLAPAPLDFDAKGIPTVGKFS